MEFSQQLGFDLLGSLVHVPLERGNDAFLHLDQVLLQFRIHTLSLLHWQISNRRLVGELFQDVPGEVFVHFLVPGNGLGHSGPGVTIPIVLPTVANQRAPKCFEPANQVGLLHPTASSETLRMPGISPLVRSRYRSRRLSSNSGSVSPWVK